MSEVSIEGAYAAYGNYATSKTLEGLYNAIIQGRARYGHRVTQIYTFKDAYDDVQLFYCQDGNTEDLLTSSFVEDLRLLWDMGATYDAPDYLKQAYADFLRGLGTPEEEIASLGLQVKASEAK